jgi:molybdopterin-containing oxidoreductase family iron-sulfur binding subunit
MSHSSQPQNESRRQFLTGAAMTSVTLASGVLLYTSAQAKNAADTVSDKVRWGLLIDANQCASGCSDCVDACSQINGLHSADPHSAASQQPQWIRKVTIKDKQTGKENSLPVMCQHCEHPPCVDVCPTTASFKRADGVVLVDRHLCIGCRYCMMACPYKARSFVHETLTDQKGHAPRGKGTVEACNLCTHLIDQEGGLPACVQACSQAGHNAMIFGDLNDPNSEIAQRLAAENSTALRPDLKLNPGVRYQGL